MRNKLPRKYKSNGQQTLPCWMVKYISSFVTSLWIGHSVSMYKADDASAKALLPDNSCDQSMTSAYK